MHGFFGCSGVGRCAILNEEKKRAGKRKVEWSFGIFMMQKRRRPAVR